MRKLTTIRQAQGLSQRRLASRARVSFRTVQMLEAGKTDPRLSTLDRVFTALGIGPEVLKSEIDNLLDDGPNSMHTVSRMVCLAGEESWKLWLFEFVDAFRRAPSLHLIECPPVRCAGERSKNLFAATVETLCSECGIDVPWWCSAVGPLTAPWFVSGLENLKASALVEAPIHFRKRNIFVLANFLERA